MRAFLYICFSIKADFITHEYKGFLVSDSISYTRLDSNTNSNVSMYVTFQLCSFHMVLSILYMHIPNSMHLFLQ